MPKADPLTPLRRQRLQAYCRQKGWELPGGRWSTSAIAPAIGKPVTKTSNLLNGTGAFGSKIAREIEDTLKLPSGYFDALGESEDFVDVRRLNVILGAGRSTEPAVEEQIGSLKFDRGFLRKCGVSVQSARIVQVDGPSMEPTIKDGAVLLVNLNNHEPTNNAIFALATSSGLLVKRLVKLSGGEWVARSDNRDFEDIRINDGEHVSIIGRAVWMGAKL